MNLWYFCGWVVIPAEAADYISVQKMIYSFILLVLITFCFFHPKLRCFFQKLATATNVNLCTAVISCLRASALIWITSRGASVCHFIHLPVLNTFSYRSKGEKRPRCSLTSKRRQGFDGCDSSLGLLSVTLNLPPALRQPNPSLVITSADNAAC